MTVLSRHIGRRRDNAWVDVGKHWAEIPLPPLDTVPEGGGRVEGGKEEPEEGGV